MMRFQGPGLNKRLQKRIAKWDCQIGRVNGASKSQEIVFGGSGMMTVEKFKKSEKTWRRDIRPNVQSPSRVTRLGEFFNN
jgi:hypothetical protein